MAATGNSSFGYFAGGEAPSTNQYTVVDRIDIQMTYQHHQRLLSTYEDIVAAGNANFGYFGGAAGSLDQL